YLSSLVGWWLHPDLERHRQYVIWQPGTRTRKKTKNFKRRRYPTALLKFPRFRGHPNICVPGVHNGQKAPTLHAGVPPADDRAGSVRSKSGEPGEGVRADGTG